MSRLRSAAASMAVVLTPLAYSPLAHGHAVLVDKVAPGNNYFEATLRVSHGCEGSPTTAVRVSLPDTVLTARPQPKPGWKVDISRRPLPEPVAGPHGTMIVDAVETVTWSEGSLADGHFDTFSLLVRLPDVADETIIYFPVEQTCVDGSHSWSELPDGHVAHGGKLHRPAPALRITPAPGASK